MIIRKYICEGGVVGLEVVVFILLDTWFCGLGGCGGGRDVGCSKIYGG